MVRTTTGGSGRAQSSKSSNPRNSITIEPRGLDGTRHVLFAMYECNTVKEEMTQYLVDRAFLRPNFTYDFRLVWGECHHSDNTESFIPPLFLLEVGFHMPFHAFFSSVLDEYGIALGQLSILSWWPLVAYFINRCLNNEPPILDIFQKIYQLNIKRHGALAGMTHFSTC